MKEFHIFKALILCQRNSKEKRHEQKRGRTSEITNKRRRRNVYWYNHREHQPLISQVFREWILEFTYQVYLLLDFPLISSLPKNSQEWNLGVLKDIYIYRYQMGNMQSRSVPYPYKFGTQWGLTCCKISSPQSCLEMPNPGWKFSHENTCGAAHLPKRLACSGTTVTTG